MAGEIKHAWNGTTLTITSDSGTSSSNLKGEKGDMGPRGPQGPCGVIYTEDGVVLADNLATTDYVDTVIENIKPQDIDLSGYATQEYVDSRFDNIDVDVDLTDYATKTYVTEKIVEVTTGGTVTLNGYATEEYVDTSIEGIGLPREKVLADETGLNLTGYVESFIILPEKLITTDAYRCTIGYSDGFVESQKIIKTGATLCSSERLVYIVYHAGDSSLDCKTNEGYTVTSFKLEHLMPGVPLSPQAIPVDDETLKINEEGKIYCDSVDLTGYATEEYVNNKAANYYTKTEIDALLANLGPVYPSAEEVEY